MTFRIITVIFDDLIEYFHVKSLLTVFYHHPLRIKIYLALLLLIAGFGCAKAQKEIVLDINEAAYVPRANLFITNQPQDVNSNENESYLLFVVQHLVGSHEASELTISSTNESIVPSTVETITDSLIVFYDHPDTSFTLTVDALLSSDTCSAHYTYSYSFINTPPVVDPQTFTLVENTGSATMIGQVAATDPEGDHLSFEVVSSELEGAVLIDHTTGQLFVGDSTFFDYESFPSMELTVAISDGRLTSEAFITIQLSDQNEAPILYPEQYEVASNAQAGEIIGRVKAEDEEGDPLEYSIVSGNAEGFFDIHPSTGDLVVVRDIDQPSGTSFSLEVKATDGSFIDQSNYEVRVVDVTGVSNISEHITIFPNPAGRFFFIQTVQAWEIDEVNITDLSGKSVEFIQKDRLLDLSMVPSGVYVLSILVDGEKANFNIIKK